MSFKTIFIYIVVVLLAFTTNAQNISDKKIVKQLKKDIGYLASDELKGRRTGSEGERLAAKYIINYYQENGIDKYKGSYLHPFTFTVGRTVGNNTKIFISGNIIKEEDGYPLAFSGSGKAVDEVMPNIMERGKIWLISLYDDEEQAKDPHFNGEKQAYEKTKKAITQGATAVVFYDEFDAKYPAVFNKKSEYEKLSVPVIFVTYHGYGLFINRNKNMHAPSVPIELNVQILDKKLTGNNILGYIDNKAKYTVIIGAHYDHLGLGQDGTSLHAAKDGAIHNGADDNASGSAALIQFASWIKNSGLKNYNYLFIHFSAEELGLIGSKKIVEQLKLSSDRTAYMINMDMIGRLNEGTHALTVGGIGTSPVWGEIVDLNTPDFKIVVDSSGVGPSDHSSFYHKEIPVLFFFTGTHKDYHKPSDDADKINYKGQAEVMHYIFDIIAEMDAQPKPTFTKTKQKSVGRVRFKVTLGVMPDYSYNDGGLRIDGVSDGRPAGVAGVKAGDIVIKLGEYEIRGIQTYMEALSKFEVGNKTEVTVKRGDEILTMPLTFTPKK